MTTVNTFVKTFATLEALNEAFGTEEFTVKDYKEKIERCYDNIYAWNGDPHFGVLNHCILMRREESFELPQNIKEETGVECGVRYYYVTDFTAKARTRKNLENEIRCQKEKIAKAVERLHALENILNSL